MQRFIVLAGGASVRDLDLRGLNQRGTLIAVNDAALYTQPHVALSKCPRWVAHRATLLETLGVPEVWLDEITRREWREVGGGMVAHRVTWFREDLDNPAASFRPGYLSGENSGHAAVNLALQRAQRGDRIYLLGFDMGHAASGAEYWYPPYPWPRTPAQIAEHKFLGWRMYLGWIREAATARGVDIAAVHCGRNLPDFPQFSYQSLLNADG